MQHCQEFCGQYPSIEHKLMIIFVNLEGHVLFCIRMAKTKISVGIYGKCLGLKAIECISVAIQGVFLQACMGPLFSIGFGAEATQY